MFYSQKTKTSKNQIKTKIYIWNYTKFSLRFPNLTSDGKSRNKKQIKWETSILSKTMHKERVPKKKKKKKGDTDPGIRVDDNLLRPNKGSVIPAVLQGSGIGVWFHHSRSLCWRLKDKVSGRKERKDESRGCFSFLPSCSLLFLLYILINRSASPCAPVPFPPVVNRLSDILRS